MPTTNKKTAPEAATPETATSFDNGSVTTAYLSKRGQDTGVTYGTWSGEQPAREDHMVLIVPIDQARNMINGKSNPVTVNRACIAAHDAAWEANRRKNDAEEKRRRERQAREQEERDLIFEVTGEDLDPIELQLELVLAYREGRDITQWLDAMKALDDLELKRAGRTSWSFDLDEEGDE